MVELQGETMFREMYIEKPNKAVLRRVISDKVFEAIKP